MKNYALIFLFPLSTFAADVCPALQTEYIKFENELRHKSISKCLEFQVEDKSISDFTLESEKESLFQQLKCKDVAFLENSIRDVESRLNTLIGFDKLVSAIQSSRTDIIINKLDDKVEIEGFVDDVATAASLETLVSSEAIFNTLKAGDLEDPKKFASAMKINCNDPAIKKQKQTAICKSVAENPVSIGTLKSLEELLETYSAVPSPEQKQKLLAIWQDELAISKDDEEKSDYSFAEMNQAIQGKNLDSLNDQVKAIKQLPAFVRVAPENKTIMTLLNGINVKKNNLKAGVEFRRMITLQNDLHHRQKLEQEARLSMLWNEFKPAGSSAGDDADKVKILKTVRDDLYKGQKNELGTHLDDALRALEATQAQVAKLEALNKCLDVREISRDNVKTICEKLIRADAIDEDKQKLLSELAVLKKIKDQITESEKEPANAKLLVMRNLSIEALVRNKCTTENPDSPSLADCAVDGIINKEMKNLIITGMDISLNYVKALDTDYDEVKEICKENKDNKYNSFCKTVTTGLSESKKPDHAKEAYSAPVDPEGGENPVKEALLGTFGKLANAFSPLFQQNNGPYYPTPYVGAFTGGVPTIAESLIGSSIYSGSLRPFVPMAVQPISPNYFSYTPLR